VYDNVIEATGTIYVNGCFWCTRGMRVDYDDDGNGDDEDNAHLSNDANHWISARQTIYACI
jgi:hypothetical protein